MSTRYVALLRGINVGRAKQLAMADLHDLVQGLGHSEVKTYLRSGQVVYTATGATGAARAAATATPTAAQMAADIEQAIADRLGMQVSVVVRSRAEIADVIDANPFLRPGREDAKLFVVFLSTALTGADLSALDPSTHLPEELALGPDGRQIYLWLPGGMGTSRLGLVKWDRVSGQRDLVATVRNWRTTQKLLELLDG